MKRRQSSLSEAWSQCGPSSSKKSSAFGLKTQRQMDPDETAPASSARVAIGHQIPLVAGDSCAGTY